MTNSPSLKSIWHIRGSVELPPGQLRGEAFKKLAPLFQQTGTRHDRLGDTLTFSKKNPAAQDKMSIFDGGTLQIEEGVRGSVLHYHLISRPLLFCFLAPLLFLAFAQLTITAGKLAPPPEAAESNKESKKDLAALPQNPIDKALGAPAPEKPKKDGKDKDDDKPSPTPGYVFAAIFAVLYGIGRVLEARLVRSLFRTKLLGG